jgi:4-hydroxy-3-polyprenylbenzoate decarboxylase
MKKIIVAITGATGVIYGIRLLEVLKDFDVESHLILSVQAKANIECETDRSAQDVERLASKVYDVNNLAAAVSSGSFRTDGMIIAPCTIKTLSAIANSYDDNLVVRAADVVLKERRRLIVAVRETPLHKGHLELMARVADLGGIVLPPVPAFYFHPRTIEDIVDHAVGKMLDLMDIDHTLFKRWQGE